MPKEKVLFDTDIGSDIDDAVCLAYLLARPECELIGITTVSGEPRKRAEMASALVKAAGRDIPIVPGAEGGILKKCNQPVCRQYPAAVKWARDTEFADVSAVEFMRKKITDNPGEVTLLAVGPMTNVGLLFCAHPETAGMLKRLVLMCGDFDAIGIDGIAEWNARCDPYAAALTYRAAVSVHRSIGLNVTRKVVMSANRVKSLFVKHELLRPVLDFAEVWFEHASEITFHDPLAAATIFDENICGFRKATVEPEIDSPRAAGTTWCSFAKAGSPEGRHEVAASVDPKLFFAHYFSTFGIWDEA